MRYFIIIALCLIAVSPWACAKPDPERYKQAAEADCRRGWKDSGLRWRLSPYKAYMNDDTLGYICQVEVDGRWVDEGNVKLTPR